MQADLKQLFAMINELQTFAKRLELPLMNTPTPAPTAVATERARIRDFDPYAAVGAPALQQPIQRVHTYAGVGLGLEEVADKNYSRQPCALVYDHDRGCWTNESDIHFPPAFSTYTCDTIILEGIELHKRTVARMGSPVFVTGGNAVGYLKGKLTVRPDVMTDATWRDLTPQTAVPAHQMPPEPTPISRWTEDVEADKRAKQRAQEALSQQFAKAELFSELFKKHLGPYEPPKVELVPIEDPPVTAPVYCEHAERLSIARRNQLASLGYQVSHLVELPAEAGYAMPTICKVCRAK